LACFQLFAWIDSIEYPDYQISEFSGLALYFHSLAGINYGNDYLLTIGRKHDRILFSGWLAAGIIHLVFSKYAGAILKIQTILLRVF
jgi:hypothetical protein